MIDYKNLEDLVTERRKVIEDTLLHNLEIVDWVIPDASGVKAVVHDGLDEVRAGHGK